MKSNIQTTSPQKPVCLSLMQRKYGYIVPNSTISVKIKVV